MKNEKTTVGGLGHSAGLRTLPLGSLNRCISNFANAPSKFLAPLGTSDMPRTLSEMAGNK